MLELERDTLQIKLDETIIVLTYPTLGQINNISNVGDDSGKVGAFFVSLGMPLEVYESLQSNHLEQIMNVLTTPKK